MTIAFPYRSATGDAVQAGAWLMLRHETYGPVPALLPEWDCSTDLTFRREIVVDHAVLARETSLAENVVRLELVVQWRVSESLLTGTAFRTDVAETATSVVADFKLEGRQLCGTLQLTTLILLGEELPYVSGPVARHAGSILWRDKGKRVRLTGNASRLPITKVDFKHHGLAPSAPWTVRIHGEMDSPAMGALQLLLNTRREDVVELLEGRTENAPAARAVRSALYVAVGRALIERAVLDDQLSDDASYDDDLLGAVLLGQMRLRFPGSSLSELRMLRESEPARFTALIDGAYRLFDAVRA